MRIVSLLSSATEILFAIGTGDQVVAISHECDYPPEATKLPRATRSIVDSSRPSHEIDAQVKRLIEAGEPLYEIDRDLICRLKPDLIVTQAQCDVCAVRYQDVVDFVAAEQWLAATQVVALNPLSLVDILQDVRRVGEAAGVLEAARRYARSLAERIGRVATKVGATWKGSGVDCGDNLSLRQDSVPQSTPDPLAVTSQTNCGRPRVVCVEWVEPLMAAGNWTPELIEIAGGASCLATPGQHSGYVAWEAARSANPEVLIIAPCGFNLERSLVETQRLMALPGYRALSAVALGRAFVIDGNAYLNRSGPRIGDSLEILAHLIRPGLFGPPGGELAEGRAWARLPL